MYARISRVCVFACVRQVHALVSKGATVLITAFTNTAVDNLLAKLHTHDVRRVACCALLYTAVH